MEPDLLPSLIALDPQAPLGLVQQIYHGLRAAILEGRVSQGDSLPSTRRAAQLLGVGRNSIVVAYELLAAEGCVVTAQGKRPVVAAIATHAPALPSAAPRLSHRALAIPPTQDRKGVMSPGSPDPQLFPADLWGRALRRAARHRQDGAEGYAHFSGLPELRQVLAGHLHRHRGLSVDPEDILVTAGTQSSLLICAHAFADAGDIALVESPGYRSAYASFAASGLACRPLAVDAEGAMADAGAFAGAKIAYVTPSTQYPSGVRMTMSRRQALLEQAKAHGTLLIEDDYDSEFVWKGRGIAALGALAAGEGVVSIGSAAKSLLPGLRIGWICAPKGTAEELRQIQRRLGIAANVHAQAALADVMSSGSYRAHINRISHEYARRMHSLRAALIAAFGDRLRISAPDGGLQLVMDLPEVVDDLQLCRSLNAAGFGVGRLADYALTACGKGLVIGFGNMSARQARDFVQRLADLIDP